MSKNILKGEYDFIFGIGEACSCTETLRNSNLQFESYPLDWLYGGDIVTRVNLLTSNFKDFINKENLQFIGQRTNPLPCDIYKNTSNNLVFNHDFPLNRNIDETYPQIIEKYNRRISRLYNNINKSENILILYVQTPTKKVKNYKNLVKTIQLCYEKIHNCYKDKNIKLLYFMNKRPIFFKVKKEKLSDNILLIKCNYRNIDETTEAHVVNNELLCSFFKNIHLNKKVITKQEQKNA